MNIAKWRKIYSKLTDQDQQDIYDYAVQRSDEILRGEDPSPFVRKKVVKPKPKAPSEVELLRQEVADLSNKLEGLAEQVRRLRSGGIFSKRR